MLRVIFLFLLVLHSITVTATPTTNSATPTLASPTTKTTGTTATTTGNTTAGSTTTGSTTASATTTPTPLNTKLISQITGAEGRYDKQTGTYKITLPRNDLKIVLNGVKLSPAMGLTSWAVFKKTENATTVKADLVVTENQVNSILNLALDNNLAVIALHNHLLWESPKVMFIHVEGVGTEKTLAEAIKTVFSKTQDTNDEASDFPLAAIDATDTTLSPNLIDNILGVKGDFKEGVYQIHASKLSSVTEQEKKDKKPGAPIISTSATFAGSNSEAVIDGDFSLHASDLHVVLRALHNAGIAVVALHEHESNNTQTRVVFVHYFGVGRTSVLAKGLRSALDAAKANDILAHNAALALATPPAAAVTEKPATTGNAPVTSGLPVINNPLKEIEHTSFNPSNNNNAPQTTRQVPDTALNTIKASDKPVAKIIERSAFNSVKTTDRAMTKPIVQTISNTVNKTNKPVTKPATALSMVKPADKPAIKPVVKTTLNTVKPADKPVTKPVVTTAMNKVKPADKPAIKPVVKTTLNTVKPADKPVTKPVVNTAANNTQLTNKPAAKQTALNKQQDKNKLIVKPIEKTASNKVFGNGKQLHNPT